VKSFPALLGRQSGVLEVQRDRLTFTSDADPTKVLVLSPFNIELTTGGQNSIHYYLKDPSQPQQIICVQDSRLLEALSEFEITATQSLHSQVKRRKNLRTLALGTPFLAVVILFFAIPFFLSLLPISTLSSLLNEQQEKKLGQWLYPLAKHQLQIVDGHPAEAAVRKLVDFLKSANPELQSYQFEIHISSHDEINAMALPGAIVVVNQGLLRKAESAEEVLGVLAHELAHVERRHLVKSLVGRMGSLVGVLFLSSLIGTDAALVIANTTDFISLKFSRDDESAADLQGFHFLHRAHVSAEGMIQFFSRLEAEEKALPKALSFLSTHPLSKERVQSLKSLAGKNPINQLALLPVSKAELNY
jgi:predicted Zn-dependent protease